MDPDLPSIMVGDVVRSLAGHDAGLLFYVIDVDDTYLTLANGRGRTLDKPKTKKRKHTAFVLHPETRVAEKIRKGEPLHDSEVRKDLAYLSRQMECIEPIGG